MGSPRSALPLLSVREKRGAAEPVNLDSAPHTVHCTQRVHFARLIQGRTESETESLPHGSGTVHPIPKTYTLNL